MTDHYPVEAVDIPILDEEGRIVGKNPDDYVVVPVIEEGRIVGHETALRDIQTIALLAGSRGRQRAMFDAVDDDVPIDEAVARYGSIGQKRRFKRLKADALV